MNGRTPYRHIVTGVMALVIVASMISSSWAMNGHAVSVTWLYGIKDWNPLVPDVDGVNSWWYRGSIVKYTIQNNSVTRCDTIHHKRSGFAQHPTLNAEGNKVAFYRWGKGVDGTQTLYKDQPSQIAVVDINGSNLRNLVQLSGNPYVDITMDWPAGDWIYYVVPDGKSVRRVNVTTGADESVFSRSLTIRRFSMGLEKKRIGLQENGGGNGCYDFPSFASAGGAGSCNIAISPSGGYAAGYSNAAHAIFDFNRLSGETGPTGSGMGLGEVATLTNNTNGGQGGELIRWAVNSDKWVLQQIGWEGHAANMSHGGNQLLCNWRDREALWTSRNPQGGVPFNGATLYICSCPGDLWVDGGSSAFGKYERSTGEWVQIPGYQPTPVVSPAVSPNGSRGVRVAQVRGWVRIDTPAGHRSELVDIGGRVCGTLRANAVVTTLRAAPGVYFVKSEGPDKSVSIAPVEIK